MQPGNDYTNGSVKGDAVSSPSLFLSPVMNRSPPPWFFGSSEGLVNLCSSAFSSKKSPPLPSPTQLRSSSPVSLTTSSISCEDDTEDAAATKHRLYLSRLALEYQEILERYELCLSHLEDAAGEAEALLMENAKLRIANAELARRLMSAYGKHGSGRGGQLESPAAYPSNLLNEFHRLQLSGESSPIRVPDYQTENRLPRKAPAKMHRSTLPKSISVRSSGYMKLAATNRDGRLRVANPAVVGSEQKLYVPMLEEEDDREQRKKEKEAATLEFEVYSQGMFKTELCNKWQETGSCPYGEQCQFAHGIAELRPVIRHPRYKTEICRMIRAGGTCPYGHRCHFRHALSAQDHCLLGPTG